MESDLKPILSAIIERLDIQSAKFDAFQREMLEFRTETNEKLDVLTGQQDFFAGKLGQHERDLHVIRTKLLT